MREVRRIGINATLLADPNLRGWNRYTVNLVGELLALGTEVILYAHSPPAKSHLARLVSGKALALRLPPFPMPYLAWEQAWLPGAIALDRLDVFHSPFNFGLPVATPCARVLTLHDAIEAAFHPDGPGTQPLSAASLKASFQQRSSRSRADRIITVSQHARADLVRHFQLPERKIDVIAEAADSRFHASVPEIESARVRRKHSLQRPYVLYVGGLEARKNPGFLVEAFAQAKLSGVDLVIAGGSELDRARLADAAQPLGPAFRALGPVEDEDLPALYAGALCFVYPSLYEGFGLQLCEAMAAGCPVLASRATSLPEVLGDGGDLFSPDDLRGLSHLLSEIHSNASYRTQLVDRARRRSKAFSWRETALKTLEVYGKARS